MIQFFFSDRKNEVDHNLEESLKFSYYLLSEWNLGECAEDLVILYSVKDHVVRESCFYFQRLVRNLGPYIISLDDESLRDGVKCQCICI